MEISKRQRAYSSDTNAARPTDDGAFASKLMKTEHENEDHAHAIQSKDPDRPSLAAYHPNFKPTEAQIRTACNKFLDVYKGCEQRNLHKLYGMILEQRDRVSRYPTAKPITPLGDVAAGKSLFISCLLGVLGIAISSDNERGTSIVHEYRPAKLDQAARFVFEAVYRRDDEISDRFSRYVHDLHAYMTMQDHKEMDPDTIDPDEKSQALRRYNAAISLFHGLFCGRGDEQFSSTEATELWFEERCKDRRSVEEEASKDRRSATKHARKGRKASEKEAKKEPDHIKEDVEALMSYAKDFIAERDLEDHKEIHTAEDVTGLGEIYNKISRPSKGVARAHPWPLVRIVRVYFHNDFLDEGNIIADTPGISYVNPHVVEETMRYIMKEAGTVC